MTVLNPNSTIEAFFKNDWSIDLSSIKVMLLNNTSAISDQEVLQSWSFVTSSVSSYETSGDGYTVGGVIVPNAAYSTFDATERSIYLTSDPITFTTTTITSDMAVFYDTRDNRIIGVYHFNEPKVTSRGNLIIYPSTQCGILKLVGS